MNIYENIVEVKKQDEIKGYIHSTESFGAVDGPGIRYVAFLQGCRMRCLYCHNPDTWNIGVGKQMTAEQILDDAERYRAFWGPQGGITLSGGESLVQIDFTLDVFKKAKARNISTCLDTAGQPFTWKEPFFSKFKELMEYTDISLVDIKEINPEKHKKLTGVSNKNIFEMIQYMAENHNDMWIRHVLVPGKTDFDEDLEELSEYIAKIPNEVVKKVEILPYHTLGVRKYREMNIRYKLDGTEPPSAQRVKNAEEILRTDDYKLYKNWRPKKIKNNLH